MGDERTEYRETIVSIVREVQDVTQLGWRGGGRIGGGNISAASREARSAWTRRSRLHGHARDRDERARARATMRPEGHDGARDVVEQEREGSRAGK